MAHKQEFNMLASMKRDVIRSLSDRENIYRSNSRRKMVSDEGMSAKGDINYANKKLFNLVNNNLIDCYTPVI